MSSWLSSLGSALSGGWSSLFDGPEAGADFLDPMNLFHVGRGERNANQQWQYEYQLQKQNFEEAKAQNEWNRSMQEQVFDYQKSLNQLQMEREDTAIARRVADLKSSGLSPTLAAGSAAAAAPMHAGSVAQVSPAQATPASDVKVRAAMFKSQLMKDQLQLATTLMGNFADISKTRAETELLKAQTDNIVTMTPIDFLLKEQAFEFADQANIYKLKEHALAVDEKQKDIDLKTFDLILSQDDHARNALDYFNASLDSLLKQKDIDLKTREYILKGLAVEAATTANAKSSLELSNLQWDTDYYHTRNMPVGMNLGFGAPFVGAAGWAHAAGKEIGSSAGNFFKDVGNDVSAAATKGMDFVQRLYHKASQAAGKLTKGVFDFSK